MKVPLDPYQYGEIGSPLHEAYEAQCEAVMAEQDRLLCQLRGAIGGELNDLADLCEKMEDLRMAPVGNSILTLCSGLHALLGLHIDDIYLAEEAISDAGDLLHTIYAAVLIDRSARERAKEGQ